MNSHGIFLPNKDNSYGPDILVRVSVPIDDGSSSPDVSYSSLTEMLMETSSKKRRVYLISITLKYYHSSSVNVDMIKEEVDKFLVPVSSQLELEKDDKWAIQLVVSTSYIYYEECFERSDLRLLHLMTRAIPALTRKNLKDFLDQQVYEQLQKVSSDTENVLNKLDPLAKLLGQLLTSDFFKENMLSTAIDRDEMEVENMRKERIPSVKSFDWNTFLREHCGFSDEEVSYCLPKIKKVPSDMLAGITLDILQELGIDKFTLRLKIRIAIKAYLSKRAHN
ncbi:hypothetical protein GAYE_PCTG69G1420 [Galdieria yellowstonensis]|uniref:Uncharacterized protein n=1 Tax=Galdieria yellowstonensis TaxID=3028027 RepID=A0AAV9I852_9RHOD|nr:hypothetical protein GAYE_PCTG69G1420 [Galdieria yellowstonensis]